MNNHGVVHKIVFVLVVAIGFIAALGWPQYAKRREISRAQDALASAVRLAEAQQAYAAEHDGRYAEDWSVFGLPLTCPQVTKDGVNALECEYYDFSLEDGKIYARHKNIAKWFTVDPATGRMDCSHEEKSVAGSHICAHVGL